MPIARHVAYSPRPGYEVLGVSGQLRLPLCTREVNITGLTFAPGILPPPDLLAGMLGKKLRLLLPAFALN